MSASLSVGGEMEWLGMEAEASMKATYGEEFEHTAFGTSTVSVSTRASTWSEDMIHAAVMTYDIYEYRVLGDGEVVGNFAVVVPKSGTPTWYNTDDWLELFGGQQSNSYPVDHEPGNLLSYPADPGVPGGDSIYTVPYSTYSISPTTSYNFGVTWSEVSGSSAGTTREFGLELGGKVSAGGVTVETEATYDASRTKTFKNEMSTDLGISVNMGSINNPNASYFLQPWLYWDRGTLVMDYAVHPDTTALHESWWDLHYREPDPAFILTHRYDQERYPEGGDPGVRKYITPDIVLNPPFAAVGDSQTITARVRNFSLSWLSDPVEVEFYQGDPDSVWSHGEFIGSVMMDQPIPPRGMKEVSLTWQVPWGTPDLGRIWARLNVEALNGVEVHTNNNKGYTILQSGQISAVYDPEIPPVPLYVACSPNPFNPLTNFEFRVPRDGRVSLKVYDVRGQLMATVVDESLQQGFHRRRWDGRDDDGRRLASGVYLYSIESGGFANTGKVVLLK
jgi:hypothetical protein